MKNYSLFLKGTFMFILLSTLTFCSKESVSEEVNLDNQSELNLENQRISTTKASSDETIFNTDARLASLYTLQYAKAVNPEFSLNPKEGNGPISIPGNQVEEYMNLDKLPLEREEINFIKEEVLHKNSRAILLKGVYDPENKKNINIVYIPYPKNLEVPKDFIHQNGLLLDDLIFRLPWPWFRQRSGFIGRSWGWNCFCFTVYRPFPSWNCFRCPFIWFDFYEILEPIIIDPKIYEEPFTNPLPIEKIPLGKSIFDLAL